MLSVLKLLVTLSEVFSTVLPLVDNGIQVWNAISINNNNFLSVFSTVLPSVINGTQVSTSIHVSINNTNFSTDVIHETTQIELRPTLSNYIL